MPTEAEPSEVEGIEDGSARDELSSYPLDDVMVRSETRTVSEIVKRIKTGRYKMNPDFQREFIWPTDKQSKLIESCVMRLPLPVLYVAEGKDGRVTVVDGLQRLTTFARYLEGEFKLTGLGGHHPLSGSEFSDLPLHLQERIEDTPLTLYILDKNAPEAARLDIFERVNSGIALTRQQMRNALYVGAGTRWLAETARSSLFKAVTGNSLDPKTMRDREAINRFCAFYLLGWRDYAAGDMDTYLARALIMMNSIVNLEELTNAFTHGLQRNEQLFGRHAFRRSMAWNSMHADRSVINISLFEVVTFGLARCTAEALSNRADDVKAAIVDLLKDSKFAHAVTYSTNSTRQVRTRFQLMEHALELYTP